MKGNQININPNTLLSSYIMNDGDDVDTKYYYRIKDAKLNEYVILEPVSSKEYADITFVNRQSRSKNTVGASLTEEILAKFRQLHISAGQKITVDVSDKTSSPDLILLFGKDAPVATDQLPYISFDPSRSSHTNMKVFDKLFV